MSKNLTPEHMRCGYGTCPSIHKMEDGKLFILGEYANSEEWAQAGDPKKSDSEAAIVISPDLLSEYVKDLFQTHLQGYGAVILDTRMWQPARLVKWRRCRPRLDYAHSLDASSVRA